MHHRDTGPRPFLRRARTTMASFLTVVVLFAVAAPVSPAAADTVRDQQWQLSFLDAQAAWRYASGKGVTVAVVDSGVDATTPT